MFTCFYLFLLVSLLGAWNVYRRMEELWSEPPMWLLLLGIVTFSTGTGMLVIGRWLVKGFQRISRYLASL